MFVLFQCIFIDNSKIEFSFNELSVFISPKFIDLLSTDSAHLNREPVFLSLFIFSPLLKFYPTKHAAVPWFENHFALTLWDFFHHKFRFRIPCPVGEGGKMRAGHLHILTDGAAFAVQLSMQKKYSLG